MKNYRVPPTHRLIYTQVKQVVAVCKNVAWLRYATRDMPRARFYGRFEDDHFVAMKLIAADLRGLAGSAEHAYLCLLYTSPSPRDLSTSRMPSSA